MSTNALVAYLNEDNSVVSSYVHWDGYTTGVGEMLLENYNTDKCARDLASTLGYASSLRETVAASHEDRANTDVAIVHASFAEFEKYVRENSYLEYAYVWTSTKWFVGSYTLEVEGVGRFAEYNSTWNGWPLANSYNCCANPITFWRQKNSRTYERYWKRDQGIQRRN